MVNVANLTKHFASIGARLVAHRLDRIGGPLRIDSGTGRESPRRTFDLDIRRSKNGDEHFSLAVTPDAPEMHVLQVDKIGRHLLLHAKGPDGGERLLCGHDERHWFVAAVNRRVSTVTEAKRALLPGVLKDAGLTTDMLARRHTDAFKRQGEWFFVPTGQAFEECNVLHGEPLLRNRASKPHIVGQLVRFGGQPVVLWRGREYTPGEWDAAVKANPQRLRNATPQRLMKDPEVYVRGSVRHPDHETLVLREWHRVYPNTEARSVNVSFYD